MSVAKSGMLTRFLFLYFFISCDCLEEPQCSRFPYEEATLERMIRTEFNVQKMAEEIKAEREKIRADMFKTQHIVETGLEDLRRMFKTEIAQKFEKMQNGYEEQRFAIESVVEGIKDTTSALFRAKSVVDTSPADKKIIVFDTTLEDTSNSYNNSSGIFTAPTSGQYFFSVQFCSTVIEKEERRNIYFAFVVDHVIKQQASVYFVYFSCVTTTFVTRLDAGSQVWIESIWDHGNQIRLSHNKYLTNVFSGMLIR